MIDVQKDFAPFEGRIWLNAASEGPLPLPSARALVDAVEWKSKPYLLDIPKFVQTQKGIKESIAKLIGVSYRDVILGNSASYGLHILANGIPWNKGDEVLVMHNDFPADILPWLALEEQGVKVRQIQGKGRVIQPNELQENITGKTRLVCLPHVHTFTGIVLDIKWISEICKDKGVTLVLNITQSAGTIPIDLSQIQVDAVVAAGYKWLCGPYGTGFCWMTPELREKLTLNRAYWPAVLSDEELRSEEPLMSKDIKTARKYDMFGTANFFNFVPWQASIDYWLKMGVDNVRNYHDYLIDKFLEKLNFDKYDLISPQDVDQRSSLVFISHKDKAMNEEIYKAMKAADIYPAFWKGNIRLAPHVYNTEDQMVETAAFLDNF